MRKIINISIATILLLSVVSVNGYSQYASKKVKSVHQAYTDSLKNINYDRVFPFWGTKAYKRGIDIPYPIGIMANYIWMDQGISIENFQLGINRPDGSVLLPLTPLDEDILGFGSNSNTSWSFNVRPDVWVFPFIDLYGIFGYGRSSTTVQAILLGTPLPTKPVEQGITTSGVGALFAGGVGPVWISADLNVTWNKPELLDKSTFANVVGLRSGKVFKFRNKPQSNISLWIGGMYVNMQAETLGAIKLNDAIDDFEGVKSELSQKIQDKIDDPETGIVEEAILKKLKTGIDNSTGESTIIYNMDKQVKQHWNGLVGAQYQLNKSWQLRAEGGVVGDRKSFLISLNYRFLGFRKTHQF